MESFLIFNGGILIPSTHVPSNSANGGWSSPSRFVPKKTGDKRLVTNFKELNDVTVRNHWPLPNLIDLIEVWLVLNGMLF